MAPVLTITNLALLLGLAFFFGLAFEGLISHGHEQGPGGIRTFPLLTIVGAMLYLFDPEHALPFTAGLLILGAWLFAYYRHALGSGTEESRPYLSLALLLSNILAYMLGPIVLTQHPWVAVGVTVLAVLLFTSRERLHHFAQQVEMSEIITAGKFLILTGIILPLLPNYPITDLTSITPHQMWLAVLAVCTLSYVSYLFQRYVTPTGSLLWIAILGGLYSSTATTVILARRMRSAGDARSNGQAGIVLATAVMYLRILVVIAIFNMPLAKGLAVALIALCLLAVALVAVDHFVASASSARVQASVAPRNPLELTTALIFAVLFIVISIATHWVKSHFGETGTYSLAAIVGVTDIDPFVLSVAQSGTALLPIIAAAKAILIAASSNNLLKAIYATSFAGFRASFRATASLLLLSAAGIAIAYWL